MAKRTQKAAQQPAAESSNAGKRLGGKGGWSEEDREKAREAIREVRDGNGGRGAQSRVVASNAILDDVSGPTIDEASNDELLAEVAKRGLLLRPDDLDAAEREVLGG